MGCRCSVTPRGVLLDPLSEHGESTDMTLLVDFLCRFSFGLAFGLCITPATLVPSGFFPSEYACIARSYDVRCTAVVNTWFVCKYMASVSRSDCCMDRKRVVVRRSSLG